VNVLLAFGGLEKPGGITPDLRNLERGLEARGLRVASEGSLPGVLRRLRGADDRQIVHVFGCLPSATIFGSMAGARWRRRRVVWTPVFHPARLGYWVGAGIHRPMQLFDHVATRAARFVDAVVVATDEEARHFEALGCPRVDLNPPVVTSTQSALTGVARSKARATLGIGDEPVILMVAAHSARRKGMSFARDTFAEVRRRLPDATLLILGGGDTEGLSEVPGVRATGWTSDEQLLAAYSCADVLFVPSRYEQFSRVTLEGWAHELPAVVSDGVALAPLVDRRGGLVVGFGDAMAAATAIETMLGDPALAHGYGTAGRALAETRFTLDGHADRMLHLYAEVLATDSPWCRATGEAWTTLRGAAHDGATPPRRGVQRAERPGRRTVTVASDALGSGPTTRRRRRW
jgi:glycosyltransferase involved in cell wall biosynthesis